MLFLNLYIIIILLLMTLCENVCILLVLYESVTLYSFSHLTVLYFIIEPVCYSEWLMFKLPLFNNIVFLSILN